MRHYASEATRPATPSTPRPGVAGCFAAFFKAVRAWVCHGGCDSGIMALSDARH
jgi:hypothetical protein